MQYLLPVTATGRYSHVVYQINLQYFREAQINNINIPPVTVQLAVTYFMTKSCICTVWLPETWQKYAVFSYYQPVPNSAKT